MKNNPFLSVKSLSVGYSQKKVIDDISFDVLSGEVFGLIGLNGAGKTTLIKTILGLRDKISGFIELEGKSKTAYLPEKFEPPYFLTGKKFIEFSIKLYGKAIPEEEITRAAQNVSFDVSFLNKAVHTYSKGMRQKIGLLATILTGCDLLILDEPMSGLDPKVRQEVKRMILSVREEGRSVFMSSHILEDMYELCDRVGVVHNNKLVFIGGPQELLLQTKQENLEKAFLMLIETEGKIEKVA